MSRNGKASAVIALCCTVAGAGLVGVGSVATAAADTVAVAGAQGRAHAGDVFTGTKKIKVDGKSVNVSCAGRPVRHQPVVVLLHGGGDSLEAMAGIQQTLSEKNRVCSYDRLGAGASDQPDGPQSIKDSGKILTGVLDRVAGDAPVVLAGHSLGGLFAARYAPDHRDRVKGLVLMDATSPTQSADLINEVPASATGMAPELRDQTLAILKGDNPEKLVVPDGKVRSAGHIPVEVIKHGKQYLAAVPEYGQAMEDGWTKGQHKWLGVSSRSHLSVAKNSEHYIYVDQPELAVKAIRRVTAQVASHHA